VTYARRPLALVAAAFAVLTAVTILTLRTRPPIRGVPDQAWTVGAPSTELRLSELPHDRTDTLLGLLSVEDAIQVGDDWLLLDSRSSRVVRLGSDGRVDWSLGGPGQGPSEFEMGQWLAQSEGTVAVLTADGNRLVRYSLDGRVLSPVDLSTVACGFGPAQGLSASSDGSFLVLKSCTELDLSVHGVVVRVEPDGEARVAGRILLAAQGAPVDPFRIAALATWNGHPYLGSLSDGCLARLDRGAHPARICLSESERLALPDSIARQMAARNRLLAERGLDFVVPEELPAFVEVRSLPSALLFRVPQPEGRDAFDLVRPDSSRTRVHVEDPRSVFVGEGDVLIVEEVLEGTLLHHMSWGAP
jgi:hypothetical protein